MPAKDTRCHADDQPSVTIHEMTHLRQIKGTEDYGAYGYEAVRRLNAAQNLNHADTYAYFANGKIFENSFNPLDVRIELTYH